MERTAHTLNLLAGELIDVLTVQLFGALCTKFRLPDCGRGTKERTDMSLGEAFMLSWRARQLAASGSAKSTLGLPIEFIKYFIFIFGFLDNLRFWFNFEGSQRKKRVKLDKFQ